MPTIFFSTIPPHTTTITHCHIGNQKEQTTNSPSLLTVLPRAILTHNKALCNHHVLSPHHITLPLPALHATFTTSMNDDLTITFIPRLPGGKGGFGNNLRGVGARKKQVQHDDGQMRNIRGDRLRRERDQQLLDQYVANLHQEQRANGQGHLNNVTKVTLDKKKTFAKSVVDPQSQGCPIIDRPDNERAEKVLNEVSGPTTLQQALKKQITAHQHQIAVTTTAPKTVLNTEKKQENSLSSLGFDEYSSSDDEDQ